MSIVSKFLKWIPGWKSRGHRDGHSFSYSGGRGLPLIERCDLLPYEDVMFRHEGKFILFTDAGVFHFDPIIGELTSELSFREYSVAIRSMKSHGVNIPPQIPSNKVVDEWLDLLKNELQNNVNKE